MKKVFFLFIRVCLYAIGMAGVFSGCKKVDDHSTMVLSQPWLSDYYTQASGSRLAPINWTYPSTLLVGDTAILIGNLFPYRAGTQITIGNVPIQIVDTAQFATNYTTYTAQGKLDAVRFVVTKEMGVGNNRPVTVTANGTTIHGAPVSIQLVSAGVARTDTTLWVDQLAAWMPDNLNDYSQTSSYLVRNVHNDKAGNIYFSNKFSVQAVTNGNVHTLIKKGDILKDDKGSSFTIKQVIGSAVTFEGDALYFSTEILDNSADAQTNYIFRLCKMDLTTKVITTVNRTLVANGYAADETGAPFQGNIAQLKVVAVSLSTDIANNLYYTNVYAPGSRTDNHEFWYRVDGGISSGAPTYDFLSCILLISRMDTSGKVHGLMYTDFSYSSTGFLVSSGTYLPDPSGKFIYGYVTTNWIRYDMFQYDITEDDKGPVYNTYGENFVFHSYESNPLYKKLAATGFITDPYPPQLSITMQLTDGTMLVLSNNSLANYDLVNKSEYCYAGTETGLDATPPPEQNKKTGLAKWVDFAPVTLIGQDKTGAVYYCTGINDYTNGVTFYKLYPKKK
jgi:hypothetical protein